MPGPILHRSPPQAAPHRVLDPAQQRVVDWRGPGTCVVLGSPATGATTTLMESVVARMRDVPAARMLVICRDRDAVKRMRAALARRLPHAALPTVTTFHGLAYALVRRTTTPDTPMPRLLSGAEEDARIRDLLRGAIDDGALNWPEDLMAASSTLGFANDLRAVLTRARELGIGPERLTEVGRDARVPAWEVLGHLAEIDDDVMALEGIVDYSRLLELAIGAARQWRGELECIWVDDFQEAGALQRHLLIALTSPSTSTVVFADPDVAAFGFRGGDRLGALRLIEEARAHVIVLDRYYAGGGQLREAYDTVRRQPALPGLAADDLRAYRQPQAAESITFGTVTALSHDTWADLAAWVADDLRRLHLSSGVAWDDMAVIARSTEHLESLRRALMVAGVPVTVAASDIPLQEEAAVATLLSAVAAAISPGDLSDRDALELITGPLLALDAAQVRLLARALRAAHRARDDGDAPPSGSRLVRDLLVDTIRGEDAGLDVEGGAATVRDRVVALGRMLADVRAHADGDQAPAQVLWRIWSQALPDDEGWSWPERLRRAALGGHLASGHDLDAVIALFATAERLSDRYAGVVGIRGLLAALSGQRVAAERVTAAAPATPAVALMTAHVSVGRSWPHVIVIGAQEGTWPPSLGSSSALRIHEWEAVVSGDGPSDVAGALRDAAIERMSQERRLFALAVSRARDSLAVAVVTSDTDQPSRFVDDLGVESIHRPGRPPRPLSLDGMVSRLRTIAEDPSAPRSLRAAAIDRLAILADTCDDDGIPLVPRADPAVWWGVADPSPGMAPVRAPDRSVTLSGSGLATLQKCPLRWFLSRVVRAEGPRGKALAIGSLVHAMAEHAARGDIPIDAAVMMGQIDRVWSELAFDAPWEAVAERSDVEAALLRLCTYLRDADSAVAVEHTFTVSIPLRAAQSDDDVDAAITVAGAIDRVEIDSDGRVHLVDFKTARTLPSARAVAEDVQLGMYQLAVQHGALGDLVEQPAVAGASLVQLRAETKADPGVPRVQEQPSLGEDPAWLIDEITSAVTRVRSEEFPAVVCSECRTCPFTLLCPAQAAGRSVLP
ncbi:MAG: PD-(D/E)XK nuclease family protein [Candidatus Nanopelagicales bacterium]